MTCGGSFPSERFAPLPAAAIASSTASLGTEEASTPSEIQSVRRPPAAITPFCAMNRDLAGPPAGEQPRHAKQDQTRLSGIGPGAYVHDDASPFAAALLLPSMKQGEDLIIEGSISDQ